MIQHLTGLVDHLNRIGYAIPTDKITSLLQFMQAEALPLQDEDAVITAMQVIFARDEDEQDALPDRVREYLSNKDKVERLRAQVEEEEIKHQERLKRLENKSQQIEDQDDEAEFNAIAKATGRRLKSASKTGQGMSSQLQQMLSGKLDDLDQYVETEDLKKLSKQMEEAILKNDMAEYEQKAKDYELVTYLAKQAAKAKKAKASKQAKKSKTEEELRKEEERHARAQEELNEALNQAAHPEPVIKGHVTEHRPEFIRAGNRSVISTATGEVVPDIKLDTHNGAESQVLREYIRRNALKFKTKFGRVVNSQERHTLNVQETILSAFKTGGRPMRLVFNKPKVSKANMVLVLDISGSCSAAAKVMMTLAWHFRSLFPGGCKVFVFVDTLYDVSDILRGEDIDGSVATVLSKVPTRGVYSNYFKPLEQLATKHINHINKETLLLFIGDARNNANPTGLQHLRTVVDKAKTAWWLNTEDYEEWGTGDSIAPEYSSVLPMHEVVTLAQLVDFIENAK